MLTRALGRYSKLNFSTTGKVQKQKQERAKPSWNNLVEIFPTPFFLVFAPPLLWRKLARNMQPRVCVLLRVTLVNCVTRCRKQIIIVLITLHACRKSPSVAHTCDGPIAQYRPGLFYGKLWPMLSSSMIDADAACCCLCCYSCWVLKRIPSEPPLKGYRVHRKIPSPGGTCMRDIYKIQ